MLIRELGNKSSKELLYRIYEAINDTFKPYKRITKKELIDNIELRYQDVHVLKNFITNYELDLIEQVYDNDYIKCTFIHRHLIDRFILIKENNYVRINPEIKHVIEPILFNEIEKDECFKYDDHVLGLINYFGIPSDDTVFTYLSSFFNYSIEIEEFDDYISTSPIINYFCLRPQEDQLCCYNLFEDVQIISNNLNKNINDLIVYLENEDKLFALSKYGFNQTNSKINQMIESIYQLDYETQVELTDLIFLYAHLNKPFIELENILNKYHLDIDLFKEAYLELNSGSLFGMPIKTYHEYPNLNYDLSILENKKQINAHLDEQEATLFYELYYSLLEYVNDKYKVCKHIDRILNQRISILDLLEIRKCFVEHKDIIDEFIIDSKDFFSDYEIEIIKEFKECIYGYFMLIKFEENYSIFMNGKNIYGVLGTHINLDQDVHEFNLPVFATWMLLPYKDKIIYDGLLYQYSVPQNKEELKEMIANNLENENVIFQIKKYN